MISDDSLPDDKQAPDDTIRFGETLKAAREVMGLSVQEAASRLNLSPRFICLFETEDLLHSSLPPIYLRGYLRAYARMLNIPEPEITAVIEKLDPAPAVPDTPEAIPAESLSSSFPLETKFHFPRLGTFFIVFALLTSVTTWWYFHNNTTTPLTLAINQPTIPNPNLSVENNPGPLDNKENLLKAKDIVADTTPTTAPPEAPATIKPPPKPQLALASTPKKKEPKATSVVEEQDEVDDTFDEQD